MLKLICYIVLAILPLCLCAQEQETFTTGTKRKVFTGFSGGMMLHGGYLFADSPDKIFSNTGLGNADYVKGLPKDGFCYGLGGALRTHLVNHFHLGAEGFMSTMPLMKTGSNVRIGWGGVLCDAYFTIGRVRPLIGLTIGGGAMRRLYVPKQDEGTDYAVTDDTYYNASYAKTPFFFLDPYVGVEVGLNNHMALIFRVDYMLPFGSSNSQLTDDTRWSRFMSPSGVRLYVGIMFGRLERK